METTNAQTLEKAKDYLEKSMMNLNNNLDENERRLYLSGCVETLFFGGAIDEEMCESLLLEYGN